MILSKTTIIEYYGSIQNAIDDANHSLIAAKKALQLFDKENEGRIFSDEIHAISRTYAPVGGILYDTQRLIRSKINLCVEQLEKRITIYQFLRDDNYGALIDPEKMYSVSYTIKQDGTKVHEPANLKGSDLTENQIKELFI